MVENKQKVLIATSPFGESGRKPVELLNSTGWEIIENPYGRRLKIGEVVELISTVDAVIAGTEPYDRESIKNSNIKVISRVGIGLDSVDLTACKDFGIAVTYTPDAPSQGVAELTLGHIINLLRMTITSDISIRAGAWNRYVGFLVNEVTVGIIGVGRIGKKVIKLLQPFNPTILACDIEPDIEFGRKYNLEWVNKREILQRSDIISLHIPLNDNNYNYLDRSSFALMKTDSFLINTSRGGVVKEDALADALLQKHLVGAALDVFENEPYEGFLIKMDNVFLTAHMGASAKASRYLMELGAVENCIKVLNGEEPAYDAIKDSGL